MSQRMGPMSCGCSNIAKTRHARRACGLHTGAGRGGQGGRWARACEGRSWRVISRYVFGRAGLGLQAVPGQLVRQSASYPESWLAARRLATCLNARFVADYALREVFSRSPPHAHPDANHDTYDSQRCRRVDARVGRVRGFQEVAATVVQARRLYGVLSVHDSQRNVTRI